MKRTRGRAKRPAPPSAVGVDSGGTFTDFVATVGRRRLAFKLPSTPDDPARAVLDGLARLGVSRATRVRHGSTVATNTLIERKGARVVLATTLGFEDLLEIGRQQRPRLYALAPRRVEPLVPPRSRFGIAERLGPKGECWRELDSRTLARAARAIRAARPEAIAIGLLHSYANPDHERRVRRALGALAVPVTLSSELCPEVREFERLSTTVANAYLMPRLSAYLGRLGRGTPARMEIVLSHGGTATVSLAAKEPVRQLLSGPAAGLRAARAVARACGFDRALTLDVGGTSTDCAFVDGGLPRRRAREIAGFPIQLPMLDVETIGAGGGSIARIDAGGLLHVGPQSAGAAPGPACYGHGGPATVTDALVVLGRITGKSLAGGALAIDRDASRRALERLGRRLGRGAEAAAEGVVVVAEARMAAALRRVSVERGHDPRAAALVAFGGAGGLHACALAESLGTRVVLFPLHAGLLSAIGALTGGARRERSRSVLLDARESIAIGNELRRLERAVLRDFVAGERSRVRIEHLAEVRYRGQSHELQLPVGGRLDQRFHRGHERRFGFADRTLAVEVVTLEVRGALPDDGIRAVRESGGNTPDERVRVRHRGRLVSTTVRGRSSMRVGTALRGPAIVLESGATLWVPPGWRARVHASGTLRVER